MSLAFRNAPGENTGSCFGASVGAEGAFWTAPSSVSRRRLDATPSVLGVAGDAGDAAAAAGSLLELLTVARSSLGPSALLANAISFKVICRSHSARCAAIAASCATRIDR